MKRFLSLIAVFALVFSLAGCRSERAIKKDIFKFVENNYDLIVEYCVAEDATALCAFEEIEKVNIVDGYVIVYCEGHGIVSSSQDYGFYYSAENRPVAVNCNLDIICKTGGLTPEGRGYQYISNSYDVFYTEHITGNIYFFSTSY